MIQYILDNGSEQKELGQNAKSSVKCQIVNESGQKFKRVKLTGSLTLVGELYDFGYRALNSCCGNLTLLVQSAGALLAKAQIIPFNCDFDEQGCKIVINGFVINDAYTPILANWEKDVNVLFVPDLVTFVSPTLPTQTKTQTQGRNLIKILHYLTAITVQGTKAASIVRPIAGGYSEFYESVINPVTSLSNPLLNLVLTHLSDAVQPNATIKATVGNMTLKSCLEQLKTLHNVYWDIDASGYLRVEHAQFYDMGGRYTIPTIEEVPDYRGYGYAKSFKFNKDVLYTFETLESPGNETLQKDHKHVPGFNDLAWPDWISGGVRYENCIPTDDDGEARKNTFTSTWITDYNSCVADAGAGIGYQGWVLTELEDIVGHWSIKRAIGKKSGANLVNGGQSMANLFVAYHRWGRSYPTGRVNESAAVLSGNTLAMRFVTPNKQYGALTAPACDLGNLRFNTPVRVSMTDDLAFIYQVDIDFSRETITLLTQTGGLCYQDPSKWIDVNIDPVSTCPPPGELLFTKRSGTFEGGSIFSAGTPVIIITDTFTDGNCGTYTQETRIRPE